MRDDLRPTWRGGHAAEHAGLAYEVLAPTVGGKVPDEERSTWLESIAEIREPEGYATAYAQWHAALARAEARSAEVELASRLLVGHGNPSAIDVGLTLQHTWGVPVIPGSALKGLLNHYVDTVLGPAQANRTWNPRDPNAPRTLKDRLAWKGVRWEGRRIADGPGELHRALFGAPPAESDKHWREDDNDRSVGETRGLITFHDAWMLPNNGRQPFLAVDVLTVHQRSYYNSQGADSLPNDYEDPNPVSFLSVKPGVCFLLAVSGPAPWTDLTLKLLREALTEWGVGGKTAAGYGRIKEDFWRIQHAPDRNASILQSLADRAAQARAQVAKLREEEAARQARAAEEAVRRAEEETRAEAAEREAERRRALASDHVLVEFDALLKDNSISNKDKLVLIRDQWGDRIRAFTAEQQGLIRQRMLKKFDVKNVTALRDEVLTQLKI